MIDAPRCLAALEATWPPAATRRAGPWRLRDGAGGGKRVSAATAESPVGAADLALTDGLVMLRPGEDAVDAVCADAGWEIVDPTVLMAGDAAALAGSAATAGVYDADAPLAAQVEVWAGGGIGPARLAVMDRVAGPKSFLVGRLGDRVAGAAFVAMDGDVAMLHALEVRPDARRRGLGAQLTAGAADWAAARGARALTLAVTRANAGARALYAAAGMTEVGAYHYRRAP